MFITLITFLLILSILVFVHELGHFVAARRFGVKAEEFGFGFPPRAIGIYRDTGGKWKKVAGNREVKDASDTIYSLNWLPLGGFVKIKGENGEDEGAKDSFSSRPIWQRTIILSAGVTMNVLLTMLLISVGLMVGMPQSLEGIDGKAQVTDKKIQIVQIMPDSPASQSGLKVGDVIMNINRTEFTTYEELQKYVNDNIGNKLKYLVKRGQDYKAFELVPTLRPETNKGGVGIAVSETGLVKYPWYLAIWEGIKTTIFLVWAIVIAFYELIKNLIIGQGVSADLSGPVGIAAMSGQVARMGFVYVMQFAALLSVNLAVINFLPFPALDGGRVLFLIIEKIKRKPVKREIEGLIHNIGFALLMLLVLLVTFRDVFKFAGKFKGIWERMIN